MLSSGRTRGSCLISTSWLLLFVMWALICSYSSGFDKGSPICCSTTSVTLTVERWCHGNSSWWSSSTWRLFTSALPTSAWWMKSGQGTCLGCRSWFRFQWSLIFVPVPLVTHIEADLFAWHTGVVLISVGASLIEVCFMKDHPSFLTHSRRILSLLGVEVRRWVPTSEYSRNNDTLF